MERNFVLPADIERESMRIIEEELSQRGISLPGEHAAVVKRVIHTTADFEYAENMRFTPQAVEKAAAVLRGGASLVTDTNMAKAGISSAGLKKLGCEAHCFISASCVAEAARQQGSTRAAAAMEKAAEEYPGAILAIGNAPTALLRICSLIEEGLRPALVIAVPVGFVNVVESKRRIFQVCQDFEIPCIAAMGRKGGSNVSAAICNALLYTALDALDPALRQTRL